MSFRDLVKEANSEIANQTTKMNSSDVSKWNSSVSDVATKAYDYLSADGYKSVDNNLIASIDEYLSNATDVGHYLRVNKAKISDYDKTYQDYVNKVASLRSLRNSIQSSNRKFSQFKNEDEYNKWYEAQKKTEAYNSVLGAADLVEYSQKGASVENPDWNSAHAPINIFGWTPLGDGKDITNMVTFAEANGGEAFTDAMQGLRSGSKSSPYTELIILINDYMTDEEKSIYNYYIGKGDTSKANEYLTYITDILRQRQGGKIAEQGNNNLSETVLSYLAGLQGSFQGIENFASGVAGTEGTDISSLQYANAEMRKDNEGVWKVANDLANSVGNMTPSMVAGGFTTMIAGPGAGKAVGSALMGISSAGNSYAEMIRNDYGVDQARKYGIMVGAAEGGLSYLFSGISSVGGKVTGNVISKAIDGIDNGIARFFVDFAISSSSEALEEGAQSILEPVFKHAATGEDFEGIDWSEVAYSALLGALSAGVLEGVPNAVSEVHSNYKSNVANGGLSNLGAIKTFADTKSIKGVAEAYRTGKQAVTERGKHYVNEALDIDPNNTYAQRMKARLDNGKDISGYQINRLINTNEQTLRTQDTAKMKSAVEARLTELGEQGDVTKLAEAIVKQASKDKLSISEKNIIKNSKYGQRVSNEISPSNIESGEYTSAWAEKIGTERINTEAYNKALYDLASEQAGVVVDEKKDSAAKNSTAKEIVSEGKFKASEDGKAKMGDTEVSIKEIASVKDGEVTLRLEDGTTVNARDVELASADEGLLYENVVHMNLNAATANAFVKGYDSSMSVQDYILGFREAYRYGEYGFPAQEMSAEGFSAMLSESQRSLAYNLGKTDAKYKAEKKQSEKAKITSTSAKNTDKNASKGIKKGRLHNDLKPTNETQRASLKTLAVLAEALGIDIYTFESPLVNGKRQGANGWYDPSDNSIHIDLYAGDDGKGTMLFTAAHELTHHIREKLPAKFKVFADFLFEQYGKKGVSVSTLVEARIGDLKKNGRTEGLTESEVYDLAYEEVVADACESFLADGEAVAKIAELKAKDKTLWETIKDFITKLVARIKAAYKGLSPDSYEGQKVAEMLDTAEQLKAMWTEMLVETGETSENFVKDHKDKVLYSERKKKIDDTVDKAIKQNGNLGVKYNQEQISEFPADIIALVSAASEGRINLKGKYVAISGNDIWHEYRNHSNVKKEAGRRQLPQTIESIKESVMAIYSPDVVESLFTTTQNPTQRQSFAYAKKSPNGYYIVVEAVGGRRNPNVVPVMLLQFTEEKWNDMMSLGMTLGELLFENDEEKRKSLDVELNKKNRVTVAQFASKEAIANTPRSPQFNNSISHPDDSVKNKFSDRNSFSVDTVNRENDMLTEYAVQAALYDAIDHADVGQDNLIRISRMPQYIVDLLEIDGEFYIYRNHAYENMVSEEQAKADGRFNRKAHYHNLGIETMTDAIMSLNDPIMTIATKSKEGNPTVVMLLPVFGKNKAPLYAVLSFYSNKDINGDFSKKPHIVLTIAERNFFGDGGRAGISDVVESAIKDGRVLDFDKKKREDLSVITKSAGLGNITETSLNKSLAHFKKFVKNFKEKNKISYSDRTPDSVSNRSLLANALESVAQNDIERNKLKEYKSKVALIESEQAKLSEIRAKIKELSFAKGKRDTETIKSLQFEANKTANRINTYDRQILNLEATKALKGVLEREKQMAYKRAEQKGKEALAAYRERATETQRELMTRYQESRKKGVESRNKTAMRHKIKDVVNELNQYLLKGTKDKHVPIELQKAVAEALDAVNMDTVSAEERIIKKREEMMRAKSPEAIEKLAKEIEHIQEMGGNMEAKLSRLKTAYDSIINSDDPLISNSHDDVIANTIDKVIEVVGDTPLRDMSLYQLEAVYDMYRMVLHSIRNANKAFKAEKSEEISVIAEKVMEEIEGLGRKKKLYETKASQFVSKFDWNNLKPVYAFERIGSYTLKEIYANVREGEDIWAVDMDEARRFRKEQFKKYKYRSWDFKERYEFRSSDGYAFKLDIGQIMSLYAYSRRGEQAKEHLRTGGFVFDDITEVKEKTKLGVEIRYQLNDTTPYRISDRLLEDIVNKLTSEQKAFVEVMQDYLSVTMAEKGNEVSMALYGVKLFKEKIYFPLKTAPQYLERAREQQEQTVKLKNKGFTKETTPGAQTQITLSSFMDVWATHVNEMSMYHALTLPMEDFYRVYNYQKAKPRITSNMSEDERYEVLKDKAITISAKTDRTKLESLMSKLDIMESDLELSKYGDRVRLFKKLGEEFSVFHRYNNYDIKLDFSFSKENMRESVSKQRKEYMHLAKLLTCIDSVIENAVGIETHNRNDEGYKIDTSLKNVYVLASAFVDGENIIPVKLEVKEFSDKENTLYVAIALESIKKNEIVKQEVATNGVARQYSPSFTISIADLLRKINPSDESFYKYIPKRLLEGGETEEKTKLNTVSQKSALAVIPLLQNTYGKAATQYIDQLLKDLNGGVIIDSTAGIINKLTGLFKKASVMLSLSVVIQQPTAFIRAMALVDAKYFVGKRATKGRHKTVWEEVKKYAPVAIIKEMGYFDTGMGKGAVEWLKGEKNWKDYVDDFVSKAPALADEITWCGIWNAVKRETLYTHKDLKPNSEEFLKAVGKRFTEVIVKTQVYDSVLARSANMRSKDTGMKMATAFMGEPTTSINMLEDSFRKGKRGKYTLRVLGAVYGSVLLNSALVSIVYAMRDDDEDETFLEKYLSRLTTEMIDGVNPLTYIPFLKDIWSILQGFDVERADMSLITRVSDAFQQLVKVINKDTSDMDEDELSEHKKAVTKAILSITDTLADLVGVPVRNVRRDFKGIINGFNTVKKDLTARDTTAGSLGDNILEDVKDSVPVWGWFPDESKGDKLYDAIIKGDTAYIDRFKSTYKDDKAYTSAIRKVLRENDPRIKQAAEARNNGDIAEYMRIAKEIIAEGNFKQDDVVAAINSEISALKKGEGSTDSSSSDKATSIYKVDDYYAAIVGRDQTTANTVKEDIINTAVANGKDQEEAEESFETSFRTYVGKRYKDGEINRYTASNMLSQYGGYDADETYWKLKEWDFDIEHGEDVSYSKYTDFYDAVKTGHNIKAVIKEYTDHGVETKTLASQITSYYKPLYKEMSNSERAKIKGYLLNAYALLGYDRSKKSKDIDKWLED